MKAVSDVIAPLSGEVLEVNEKVVDAPETSTRTPTARAGSSASGSPTRPRLDALLDVAAYGRSGRPVSPVPRR